MSSGPSPVDNSVPGTLGRGASIGRYVVLGLVGRGGMGEVYAAYDPELDRKVAVKLLRIKPNAGVSLTEGRQRTLREAQAIARLSHPNVVVAYDVGTFHDQVFIAMEFVEGNTVTYWMQAQERTWQEVLKVFAAAGRGLVAAHEKGLVHRDFKPDNVMVGRDGQVRVMDFGLARQMDEKTDRSPERLTMSGRVQIKLVTDESSGRAVDDPDTLVLNGPPGGATDVPGGNSGMFDVRLTRTGAMMGTPAYMAPEQFRGKATDARTDQFSFCVSLYEALYGERPFAGNTMVGLTSNVVNGVVKDAPSGSKVPVWLRKILLRALRPNPDERYTTLEELLEALGKNPYATRRKVAIAGVVALLPIALAFGVRQTLAHRPPVCGGGSEKLAGIWEPQEPGQIPSTRQEHIRGAFQRSGKTYAADVYSTVSRALTTYARAWATMYRETCEATQVRGEQSVEVLDLRMSCLTERLAGLRALTDVFSEASGDVVENAVTAANSLPSLDRCADIPLLRAVVRPPEDATTKGLVADLRDKLATVRARSDAGRLKEARQMAPSLVAEARLVGYKPLLAEALALLGGILLRSDDGRQGERVLIEAFRTADASRHDEVRALVAENLVFVVGYQENRFDEAHNWADTADSVLQRLGGHDLMRAWLLNDLGSVHFAQGQGETAVRLMKESIALKEKALGRDHPDVGVSEGNLAGALSELGRNEEALGHIGRSITLLERGLGASHPNLATQLSNQGEILSALGHLVEGRKAFERSQAILERELGPESRSLTLALTGIGVSYLAEGKPSNAIIPLERAYRIQEVHETHVVRRAETAFALARALWEASRDRARARHLADQARALYARVSALDELTQVERWLREHGAS